jgi:WD40 repeat protein
MHAVGVFVLCVQDAVEDVAVSPGGDIVASVSTDRTLRLWKNNVYVLRGMGRCCCLFC